MSRIKNYYHDEICGQDESNDQGYGDWAYEQMKDRDLDRQLEEQERQQKEDKDYELISIDYSKSSLEQFQKDLLDPSSELVKALALLGEDPC